MLYWPVKLTRITRSQSSGERFSIRRPWPMRFRPALLTRMSTRPRSAMSLFAASFTCRRSPMSSGTTTALPFLAAIRAAVSSSFSLRLPISATVAPSSVNMIAPARPIPLPPPVIHTTFPLNTPMFTPQRRVRPPWRQGGDPVGGDLARQSDTRPVDVGVGTPPRFHRRSGPRRIAASANAPLCGMRVPIRRLRRTARRGGHGTRGTVADRLPVGRPRLRELETGEPPLENPLPGHEDVVHQGRPRPVPVPATQRRDQIPVLPGLVAQRDQTR